MSIKYEQAAIGILFFSILFSSCFKRELNSEYNYINLKRDSSIKDNEMLRFKTFRINEQDGFLIFGNNNEVSVDGNAIFPLYFFIKDGNKRADINLTGCTYEYTSKLDEILFKGATLRSNHWEEPFLFDLKFSFSKAPATAGSAENFNFKLKQIILPDNKTLSVGDKAEAQGVTIGFMSEFAYVLVYYRN